MAAAYTVIVLSAYLHCFSVAVSGELVVEKAPVCPDDSAVYRCSVNSGRLEWYGTPMSGSREQLLSLISGRSSVPRVETRELNMETIVFNITSISSSYINVIATVNVAQLLYGTIMECEGNSLTINSLKQQVSNLVVAAIYRFKQYLTADSLTDLPTALGVSLNESKTIINPNVEGHNSIQYQLSGGSLMTFTQPIIVSPPETISFILCQENSTFFIDTCLLNDDINVDRNYTLFANGTWLINRRCNVPNIFVTCINGSWSECIDCIYSSTTDIVIDTNSQAIATTTDIQDQELHDTSNVEQVAVTACNEAPFSQISANYGEIIGTAIGSFIVALILGNIMGLVCGVKYTRYQNKQQCKTSSNSNNDMKLNKGLLYEDIDKHVELSQNVSYDVVKIA